MTLIIRLILTVVLFTTVRQQPSSFLDMTAAFSKAGSIYITDFKGEPKQLTDESTYNILPTWSHDGKQLAFLSDDSKSPTGQYHVAVTNVATHEIKQVSSLEVTSEANLAWSPDGKHIAVTLGALFVIDLETGETRELSVDKISAQNPSWSPDSQRIAFSAVSNVYVIYADGHDIQAISTPQFSAYSDQPQWSPDGKSLVFLASHDDQQQLVRYTVETQTLKDILTTHDNSILDPQWSPDGKKIAFTVLGDLNAGIPVIDSSDVYTVDVNEANLQRVSNLGVDYLIGWSNNNQHILYQSQELGGATARIYAVNVVDGIMTNLSKQPFNQLCEGLLCESISVRPRASD